MEAPDDEEPLNTLAEVFHTFKPVLRPRITEGVDVVARALLLYHEDFKAHTPEPYEHPENPGRLEAALSGLRRYGVMDHLEVVEPGVGELSLWTRVHTPSYVKTIISVAEAGGLEWIDGDTYVGPGTLRALKRLTGAVLEAVDNAVEGGFSLVLGRPPGHHAGIAGRAMGAPTNGFCIFNASALAARLLSDHGRVVVVDFDLHHGNGTQEIFFDDPTVIHVDVHQDPLTIYPGTGFPEDIGVGRAKGTKVNIVVPPESGDDVYLDALELVESIAVEASPDYLVYSMGFDAYRGDNYFTVMHVGSKFFHEAGRLALKLNVKGVVAVLEGGYGPGLRRALPAFAAGLLGLGDPVGDDPREADERRWREYEAWKERLRKALGRYWASLGGA